MPEVPGGFGNLHCPWWSENPSLWRCVSLVALKDEKIHELYMAVETKVHEMESLQADLLGTKIQLDTATAMLQFMEPTAKAASKPPHDTQLIFRPEALGYMCSALVATFLEPWWLHLFSPCGYMSLALVATFL